MKSVTQLFRIPEKVLWRIDDGNTVLFDEDEGQPFLLNQTGTQTWRMIHEGKRVEAILRELHKRYPDISEDTIRNQTLEFIEELLERKLLESSCASPLPLK